MSPEYTLFVPGEEPVIVGETDLGSIVVAAVDVFSQNGGREFEEYNALILSTALNSAIEAGANKEQIRGAYQIGEQIGRVLLENRELKKRFWRTYTSGK